MGAAAIGAALQPACTRASTTRRRNPIGVQLYTVRGEMQRDLEATLARVAEIGYQEVEFAGYFNRSPAEIAALLRQNGLSSPSTHVGFDAMRDDWERVLQDSAEAGHTYVTIPWIAVEDRRTISDWQRVAALFNERAAQAHAAGLRFAYHNHEFEFEPIDGTIPFDILLNETDPDLAGFELDIYWITYAGHDALDYFTRFPGRFSMTHLKDSAGAPDHEMRSVGSGSIDFPRIIAAADAAGVQHHFVEHDNPADPLASIQSSYEYLAALPD